MFDGPPPPLKRMPMSVKPPSDTILEVSSTLERASTTPTDKTLKDHKKQDEPPQIPERTLEDILEVDEDMAVALWREVQTRADEERSEHLTPPISLMDGNQSLEDNCPADSLNQRTISNHPSESGEYGQGAPTIRVPSLIKPKEGEIDANNMQAALAAPITCTLPLGELLKVRPQIWEHIGQYLQGKDLAKVEEKKTTLARGNLTISIGQIPLNKVSGPSSPSYDNTTLLVEHTSIVAIAILDSGAGISIATKSIW